MQTGLEKGGTGEGGYNECQRAAKKMEGYSSFSSEWSPADQYTHTHAHTRTQTHVGTHTHTHTWKDDELY